MLPFLLKLFFAVLLTLGTSGQQPELTPAQKRILSDANTAAREASQKAEGELLNIFGTTLFGYRLSMAGSSDLAQMSPQALLAKLKDNLAALEYTDNFGLDAMSRKLHPGREAMDLTTIEKYGHIPTDWEMKINNSTLTANVSAAQWAIYDAAETGIYGLPEFANPLKPTAVEILDRPKYLAGNIRRQDIGLQRYGAMGAVLRNDVVRDRAIFAASDSGGWEGICNKSVVPIHPSDNSWWHKMMIDCTAMLAGGSSHPIPGVLDHQLHTLLANAKTFGRVGGALPGILHQLLATGAQVRPIEVNMYTEGILLGANRMADWKLLVGSFPGLFGTREGQELREFCKRHGVPLAWGLGCGKMWPDEETQKHLLTPYEPWYFWTAGQARLLDPVAGWPNTNVTGLGDADGIWDAVWTEVETSRKEHTSIAGPGKDRFEAWWAKLGKASGFVPPLRGHDCASPDLCFGTYQRANEAQDCVCRKSSTSSVSHPGVQSSPSLVVV